MFNIYIKATDYIGQSYIEFYNGTSINSPTTEADRLKPMDKLYLWLKSELPKDKPSQWKVIAGEFMKVISEIEDKDLIETAHIKNAANLLKMCITLSAELKNAFLYPRKFICLLISQR